MIGLITVLAILGSLTQVFFIEHTITIYKRMHTPSAQCPDWSNRLSAYNVTSEIRVAEDTSLHAKRGSNGYDLAKLVRSKCERSSILLQHTKFKQRVMRLHAVLETKNKHIQLCPVWKVSTTFIRRLFLIKDYPEFKHLTNPYNISFGIKRPSLAKFISSSPHVKKFVFVRNPYNRILSCYIDKLLAPNPVYWSSIGVRAIKLLRSRPSNTSLRCGHDLTFLEFVKYVTTAIDVKKIGTEVDPHFMPILDLCQPCRIKYDFIGKLETFDQDYPVLIKSLNLKHSKVMLDLLHEEGDELRAIDAIADSVHTPFTPGFEPLFKECINHFDILQRSWRKMQIRGLIGTEPLPINKDMAVNITEKDLFEIAKASRRNSRKEERQTFKSEQFLKFYKDIDIMYLERLRLAYYYDFKLFGYDDRPKALFDSDT